MDHDRVGARRRRLAWLYTRIPHRGLLLSACGLLAAVFVRLALNPEVFRYEPRGDMRHAQLVPLHVCDRRGGDVHRRVVAVEDRRSTLRGACRGRDYLLPAGAVILLFLLLNIEIADYYCDRVRRSCSGSASASSRT